MNSPTSNVASWDYEDVLTKNTSIYLSSLNYPRPLELDFNASASAATTVDYDNYSNATTNVTVPLVIETRSPLLGLLLAFFCVATVFGNMLVVVSVARERYLRNVTNYFIVSLATADLLQGAIVMPFAAIHEFTMNVWLFGADWCDLWHSFDVLGSTASILNLCVISLDRYWAITDPFAYPSRMSTGRAFVLITLVWICSASISFPAIIWWRNAMPPGGYPSQLCIFTEDKGYLIFSSLVSFYIPLLIMLFAYCKIFKAANKQIQSLKTGSKKMAERNADGMTMTLRIHRGGSRRRRSVRERELREQQRQLQLQRNTTRRGCTPDLPSDETVDGFSNRPMMTLAPPNGSTNATRRFKNFSLSKKLAKMAKEQKAAKTLGIVVGAFVICWLPFFVTNVLSGICSECIVRPDIIWPLFTWLGYINSGINPVIYSLSSRDFRRAFYKTMCTCCPGCVRNYFYVRSRRRMAYQNSNLSNYSLTYSSTSFTASVRL